MIVMLTARRLEPGASETSSGEPGTRAITSRRAFSARTTRATSATRTRSSPGGLFDMTVEDYRRWRADVDAEEAQRVDRLSAFVENEHVSGVYGVVDVVEQ
jgi:hypothetical protein